MMDYLKPLQVIWDYLCLNEPLQKADCIVGFGNFNTDIARRAAELYHAGYAPKILFTGGLGRNTDGLLPEPEAVRFAKVAMKCGVPEEDIILEPKSTNTKENILFTREKLKSLGLTEPAVLGVHQPFMERRIKAAMGVYWPELNFRITSPQVTIPQYLEAAKGQGITENASVSVIVGDFQRMDLYAKLGYQLPQHIPEETWEAFRKLVEMGFDQQLAK
ncbi:MAG: YdcF family protein [Oscillospiraceae bacterium]|nr:YdcF family protein [Oscillospiraceae bacterium]